MDKPKVTGFFHEPSGSITYVVHADGATECAVIDPVLDFDVRAMRTATTAAERIVSFVRDNGLETVWILETHAHADRLSAAPFIKAELGGRIAIAARIGEVQQTWNEILHLSEAMRLETAAFDHLFEDGETFAIGPLSGSIMHTPGHTPADLTYVIGDAAFIGDTMFMPDYGTARADFPGGSATDLYRSIRRILSLPPETRIYLCHDYLTETRKEHRWETTVAEQREGNIHIRDGIGEQDYVAMRLARDKTLPVPALLLPAIQINLRAGHPPPEEQNGVSYLKMPFNRF